MKRFLFSVCALAAVVVGCSKSEVLNRPNADMPIEFNPYTGRIPVTRAVAADIDTLGHYGFRVYAFMHNGTDACDYTATPYMNKVVTFDKTLNEGKGAWTYSGHAYWPATNLLNFVAYGLNAGATEVANDRTTISYTVPVDVASQKDLLVAYNQINTKYTEDNQGVVDFTFSHLLSRIGFSLVTKASNGVPVTIEQVNLVGDFYGNGTVRLTDGKETTLTIGDKEVKTNRPYVNTTGVTASSVTYKLLGENGTYTSVGSADGTKIFDNGLLYTKDWGEDQTADNNTTTDDDEYDPKPDTEITAAMRATVANNEKNRYMMIIPAEGTVHKANLKVKYFLPGAGTFEEVTVPLSDVNFEAGKSYDFKLKVSTNGISFSVDVESWDVTGENRETIQLN
jgi:hypothetical protein